MRGPLFESSANSFRGQIQSGENKNVRNRNRTQPFAVATVRIRLHRRQAILVTVLTNRKDVKGFEKTRPLQF